MESCWALIALLTATFVTSARAYSYNSYYGGVSSSLYSYSSGCVPIWLGDGYCDPVNNIGECDYDGGDCCACSCVDGDFFCGIVGYNCTDPFEDSFFCNETWPPISPCVADAQQSWVVEDAVQAQAMKAIVECSGGSFQVEWRGNVVLDDPIHVVDGTVVTVTGSGSSAAVINGNGSARIFAVNNATLHLSDVSITSGYSSAAGGAIAAVGANLTFNHTNFLYNRAEGGGGALWLNESSVSWSGDTEFVGNTAESGGAIFIQGGSSVSWTGDTNFTSNTARSGGGAVGSRASEDLSTISISSSSSSSTTIFSNNTSGKNGGALALFGGLSINMDVGAVSFVSNTAGTAGGAIFVSGMEVGPTFTDVLFGSNSAQIGGAISIADSGKESPTTAFRCRFIDNQATQLGGAIESAGGQDSFVGNVFTGNKAETAGGALRLAGAAVIEDCLFEDNVSGEGGGAAVSNMGYISNMENNSFIDNVFNCLPDTFVNYSSGDPYAAACRGCLNASAGYVEPPLVPICSDVIPNSRSEGGTVTLETLSIDPGYWRATNSSILILACYNDDACVGGQTGTPGYCKEGYEGPYCAVCSDGHTAQPGFTCSKCSNTSAGAIVLATFLAVVSLFVAVGVASYAMSREIEDTRNGILVGRLKRYIPLQSLKIVVVAWQVLTQFASVANVTYPDVYENLLNGLDLFNFDLAWILSAGCIMDVGFHERLLLSTISPVVGLLFLAGTYTAASRINREEEAGVLQVIYNKHVSMVLLLTFLIYSSVSSVVFQAFACEELDDGGNYLRADYRIECDSSKHVGFQVYAGFMTVAYAVGIPAFYSVLLFRDRDVLKNDKADREEDSARVTSTSGLWEPYRPSVFYYEVIECARRLLLAGLVVFIYPNTAAQIAITLMMAFVFVVVLEVLTPYASRRDTWLSRVSHIVVFVSVYVALLLKVDVSDEQDSSQRVFEAVLVAAHVCLVLAIMAETVVLVWSSRVEQWDEPVPRISSCDDDNNSSTVPHKIKRVVPVDLEEEQLQPVSGDVHEVGLVPPRPPVG